MAAAIMERDEPKPAKSKAAKARSASSSNAAGREYSRPRGGPAKPIADLMPQIGRAAFRRFGFVALAGLGSSRSMIAAAMP